MLISHRARMAALALVTLGSLVLAACGQSSSGSSQAGGGASAPSGPSTVKVGVMLPLTGNTAWAGKTNKVAAEMAAEEINASGAAGKYKIELAFADSQCEPGPAHDAAQKLITQDKAQLLIGEWCSSASVAAAQVARDNKIPLLVEISTADGIAKNGGPYTFQSIMQNRDIDQHEAKLLTEKFNFATVGMLVENNDFGLTFRKNMTEFLTKAGKKITIDVKQDRSDTNFYPVMTRIQSEKPDILVISLSAGQSANFVKALAESGITIPVVSDYPPPPYIFEKQVGQQAAKIGLVRGTFYLDNPNITPRQKEFIAKFEPRASQAVGEQHYATHWDIAAYDSVYLVADALKRGGPDPANFAKAMAASKLDGVLGHYEFDQNREVKPDGLPFVFIKDVEGGKLEVVK